MSKFEAPLCNIKIEKHPNADSLSIATIDGLDWQCVVRSDDFVNDNLAVYIPLQSIASCDHPLLSFLNGKRVETCKLRGVLSQGVLLPYSKVLSYMKDTLGMSDQSIEKVSVIGKDFSGILRIKKWEDTTHRFRTGGNCESPNPKFQKYTDIENIKNFRNVLQIGEPVHISEKIHGTSSRFAYIDGEFMIASRNNQLKLDGIQSVWHFIYDKYKIKDKLLQLSNLYNIKDVSIYGEIAGPRIQDLHYGQKEPELFVYDIIVDGKYLPPCECDLSCQELGLQTVPVLKVGPLEDVDFNLRLGPSTLTNDHVREGIVIKPVEQRWDTELGRVILKVISEDYLLRKGATDFVDA